MSISIDYCLVAVKTTLGALGVFKMGEPIELATPLQLPISLFEILRLSEMYICLMTF